VTAVGAEQQFVELPDALISYYECGQGEPFVLLHGGGPGASGWSNFSRNAPDFQERYRVVLPDMPGYGDSELRQDRGGAYLAEAARCIAAFIEQFGVGPVNLLGNSLGGAVSTRLAGERPDLVKRLVLMGAAGIRSQLFTPTPMEGVKQLMSYYPEPTPQKMRTLVKTFVYDDSDPVYDEIAAARYQASLEPKRAAGHRRVSGDPRFPRNTLTRDDLEKVQAPTLLIWGRDDRFVGVDDALTFLAGIRNARLLILPNCGHWVQAEHPQAFAAHLTAFLTEDLG
jgi:2-hydroxy-6-oxonona-2,4-dienedioate hydrolase/4,5:9,10-diseco-3-hydroxy-5,9,17-trioxoandrosta-1(10),2-diene-4-oate hydrolase